MLEGIILFYLGGVLALFMESIVQWLHPQESNTNETPSEALKTALAWPVMALVALVEIVSNGRK